MFQAGSGILNRIRSLPLVNVSSEGLVSDSLFYLDSTQHNLFLPPRILLYTTHFFMISAPKTMSNASFCKFYVKKSLPSCKYNSVIRQCHTQIPERVFSDCI